MPDAEAGPTYLAVPYAERDEAKRLGARWDGDHRAWFVPPGRDPEPFRACVPDPAADELRARQAFAEVLRGHGLRLSGLPEMDGAIHRVRVDGDTGGERSGAYLGALDGWPAGWAQNFKTGEATRWKAENALGVRFMVAASDTPREKTGTARDGHGTPSPVKAAAKRQAEREAGFQEAARKAQAIWDRALPMREHPYLAAKGIGAHGARQGYNGTLLVPVRDMAGNLMSLQWTKPDGEKGFLTGGKVAGGCHVIGDADRPGPLLIAEGFATAATVHEATGMPCAVAFHANNLAHVAQGFRDRYPDRAIFVAGDNDHQREAADKPNVGKAKAEEAASAIGGVALLPRFGPADQGSDWNDFARLHGMRETRAQLLTGIAIAEREKAVARLSAERAGERPQWGREIALSADLGR